MRVVQFKAIIWTIIKGGAGIRQQPYKQAERSASGDGKGRKRRWEVKVKEEEGQQRGEGK